MKEVGIREGEKLHEEMISTEEWVRTQEFDYAYLIGHEQVRQAENWSFNSKDSLMSSGVTREFLKNNKVI